MPIDLIKPLLGAVGPALAAADTGNHAGNNGEPSPAAIEPVPSPRELGKPAEAEIPAVEAADVLPGT
jgi:hypothetical protein